MKIDPSLKGKLPEVHTPEAFAGANGRIKGWKVRIPGQHPLATPAVADGNIFLGGGFGSYDFFAFDADTGAVALGSIRPTTTGRPPPSSPRAASFNTESCDLEVLTLEGRPVWKKWLGDPLLSIPAAEDGRVFIAFPGKDHRHVLGCFSLADGNEIWRQPINGEIITSPVLADGHVYLTCLDGTLFVFEQRRRRCQLWSEAKNATSSPAVWRRAVLLQPAERGRAPAARRTGTFGASGDEGRRRRHANLRLRQHTEQGRLSQLRQASRRSPHYMAHGSHDAGVGFAHFKGGAKTHQSRDNLGTDHVYGVWTYQGSKPFLSRGRMYSGMGDTIHCVDPDTKETYWKKRFRNAPAEEELLDSLLTPPALVNGKAFFGTIDGRVFCLDGESGETLWSVEIGEPVIFQPAVARGRVYVSTAAGSLFALETSDSNDDGWFMWGATPAHNGVSADNS